MTIVEDKVQYRNSYSYKFSSPIVYFPFSIDVQRKSKQVSEDLHNKFGEDNLKTDGQSPRVHYEHYICIFDSLLTEGPANHLGVRDYLVLNDDSLHKDHSEVGQCSRQQNYANERNNSQLEHSDWQIQAACA